MTASDDLERYAGAWFREIAAETPADYLEVVLERTRRTRQRPAWSSVARWLPSPIADLRLAPEVRTVALVLLLVALVVTFALAVAAMGGFRRLPPPYGPAANGLIAFDNGGIIYLARADGSSPRAITDATSFDQLPVWSPDGTKLGYVQTFQPDGPQDEWFAIYDVASDTRIRIRVPDDNYAYWGITWSPDSRSLAFSADHQGRPSLYVVDADGAGLRRLELPDTMRARYPAWSPDGKQLAFSGAAAARYAVWEIAPDGTGLRRLTDPSIDEPYGIAWSPDGSRVVYASNVDESPRSLRVVNADASGDRAITSAVDRVGAASWSPDGRFLAFILQRENNPSQLVVTRPDGSPERALSTGRFTVNADAPAWSPDGTKIVSFVDVATGCEASPCDPRLITVDLETGSVATMPPLPGRPEVTAGYYLGTGTWQRLVP